MYRANLPSGYRGSPGQASSASMNPQSSEVYNPARLPGRYNGQSYRQAGGPNEGHRPVRREFQEYRGESHAPLGNRRPFSPFAEGYTIGALTVSSPHYYNPLNAVLENANHHALAPRFSNSEGAPAQLRPPSYEGRPADRAVLNVQGIYDFSSPLSSPGRNPGLKSLNQQHLTASTPSSSPPTQDARQSPGIRNSTSPSQASERCSCPYPRCNQEFTGSSRKGNMSRHIRTKHGAPGSRAQEYFCSSRGCGKMFRRSDAKLNHERKEHPGLGRLSAVPRRPLDQAATRGLDMSTPQK